MRQRAFSLPDRWVIHADRALRTVLGGARPTGRSNPAGAAAEETLSRRERSRAARLMRVDHAGEVAAQALYHGQSVTARDPGIRETLEQSAREENDHLVWCEARLGELGGRTSRLGPLWYAGSFAIGALAGAAGDRWSLGFLAETERQVERHLDGHLVRLPAGDHRSRLILAQMREDEVHHATVALRSGARPLPFPVRKLMRLTSRVMTTTAYWI